MFEEVLSVKTPWKIDEIKLQPSEKDKQEIHVFLSYQHGSTFRDATGTPCPIHKTYDKTWQHIDFEKKRCYIHCKVPRIRTTEGTLQAIDVPWARSGSRFSLPFETKIMQKIGNSEHFKSIGDFFGEEANRIWTVFNGWVNTAYTEDVIDKDLSAIGITEISDQEKGKQITITIDLKNERVLHVTQGIGKKALQDICFYLENKGVLPEQIKHASGPLSSGTQPFSGFLEAVKTYFPNAEYHIDRLYIVQLLNDAIDQVRKKESYRTKNLTLARALFVKHPALLSEQQKNEVQKLSTQFPNVGQAYELKNAFFALWEQSSPQIAEVFLESWWQEVNKTKLSPLKRAAELLKTHKQHVVRFSVLPTDPTVMEKAHEIILVATKRTKGLKNLENVKNMIYFCTGKLTFPHA